MLFLTIAITCIALLCECSLLLVKLKAENDDVKKVQEMAKKVKGEN